MAKESTAISTATTKPKRAGFFFIIMDDKLHGKFNNYFSFGWDCILILNFVA